MRFARATFLSFLIAAFTFFPMELIPADAESTAIATNASGATTLSTATFVVYATSTSTGANPGGTALVLNNSANAQYFYIRNTGTVSVAAVSITLSYSIAPIRTDFSRCDLGVAFASLNTCATGTRTVISAVTGVNTVTLSLPPNSFFAFELDPKKLTTPTVSVSVSSSQIRPVTTTNS
ncbi:MAG: hypothetical protein H7227_02715 [Actinobacteria bacterium]|nr:hypothetical protein [Actinomycetota bacterium]